MDKLIIKKKQKSKDTITRTIRFSGKYYDKIADLAEKENLSFNYIVNQLIEYSLNILEEQEKEKE